MSTFLWAAFVLFIVGGALPIRAQCNYEWLFPSLTNGSCSTGFALQCGTCYSTTLHVQTLFSTYNDNSIRTLCYSNYLTFQGFHDSQCQQVDYQSNMSSACNQCFQINTLLVSFQVQGLEIGYHGYGGPPSASSSSGVPSTKVILQRAVTVSDPKPSEEKEKKSISKSGADFASMISAQEKKSFMEN